MIDFKIKPDGGEEFDVKAGTRDILLWERTSRGKSFSKLMNDLNMGDLYSLAHMACKRQQLYTGSLAEFEEGCELVFEVEEPDPTQPAASTGG